MGNDKSTASRIESLRPLLDGLAKNIAQRLYGPDGPAWGTLLSELEDDAVAVRTFLAERLLHHALERQAQLPLEQRPAEVRTCPSCRGPLETRDSESRIVQTRGGEAEWSEPHLYCPSCRKAFFPSVALPGPGPD